MVLAFIIFFPNYGEASIAFRRALVVIFTAFWLKNKEIFQVVLLDTLSTIRLCSALITRAFEPLVLTVLVTQLTCRFKPCYVLLFLAGKTHYFPRNIREVV